MTAKSALWLAFCLGLGATPAGAGTLGLFDAQSDVGSVTPPGTGAFDAARGVYTLTSAGANAWYREDGFHFVWKKVSGDIALQADVAWPPVTYGHDPVGHRKALLMFRQSLDPGAVYADAAPHGDGTTALQYRRETGANTQDIEINLGAAKTVRLEKRGDTITLLASFHGEALHRTGASITLHLEGTFYAGIGLTSHDVNTTDVVQFANVKLEAPAPLGTGKPATWSTLQVVQTEDPFRRAMMIRTAPGIFEGPNRSPDGSFLLINSKGRLWKVPLLNPKTPSGGEPAPFDAGDASGCWGEHGFSPDGKWLAVSCSTPSAKGPDVYLVPAGGGPARRVTHHPVSFFRGWSPDSATVVFASIRGGSTQLYAIPALGGRETLLTSTGNNDGAEYTPDGAWLYFNSDRTGAMQIWRMRSDGSQPEQVTHDAFNDWYPHVAPDGKQIVFLSYARGVMGHAMNRDVSLRLLDPATGDVRKLVDLFGGQGSLDSPSWIDKNHLGFTSYEIWPEGTP